MDSIEVLTVYLGAQAMQQLSGINVTSYYVRIHPSKPYFLHFQYLSIPNKT